MNNDKHLRTSGISNFGFEVAAFRLVRSGVSKRRSRTHTGLNDPTTTGLKNIKKNDDEVLRSLVH